MKVPVIKALSENKEFVYAVVLILIIPAAFIANTFLFVRGLNDSFDTELTSKANLTTAVLASTLEESIENKAKLRAAIDEVTSNSPEIKGLTILSFEKGAPVVLATNEGNEAVSTQTVLLTKLAWTTGQPYTTKLEVLNEEAKIVRHWQVSLPVKTEIETEKDKDKKVKAETTSKIEREEVVAVINLKVSGEKSDVLISNLERNSIVFTLITLFVIVLLLLNHFKFFGYARLFAKLKEVDEMKDNFISLASHELRTPVTALKGFASLGLRKLQKGDLQAAAKDVDMVNKSAESINSLVNDLLDVSRIEQKRLKFEMKVVELTELLSTVVLELEVQAKQKGLILTYEKPNRKLFIEADVQKLKQVFVNLIGNAIKYTPKGNVTLSHEAVGNQIKTFVKDTGLGIPAEEIPNLFEKFHRVQNEQTNQIRGTGLGLWITKQLIEMMKGKILVESIEKRGTSVIVIFPSANVKEKQP
jgi:signal transduction histidine kinase